MRFDVHTVRCNLVNELMDAPHVKEVWHDGSDVVILDFKTGESVAIHLIERYMSINEIEYILNEDARSQYYTMLILWADMFMPSNGQVYEPDDWMLALMQLYGGKIYAYDAWRSEPYVFTVHFHRVRNSHSHLIQHGAHVNIAHINVDTIETNFAFFSGFWRVARFDGVRESEASADDWQDLPPTAAQQSSVGYYFNILGVKSTATREEVKQAYRAMARKHHPDRNPDVDTTKRMQQINQAYMRLTQYFDSADAPPPS